MIGERYNSQGIRRKFRSQTSDNMDRWKGQEGRKEQKKRDASARKGRKVAKHCFFHWFVAPEGRKVGSLKRRVRSHLARSEMKNCTPLWREADFKVKKLKAPHIRRTFGSWDVEKAHAVLARSTFRCQNVQNTCSDHLWKDVEKVHTVLARSTFRCQNVQNTCSDWDVEKAHAVMVRSTCRSQNVQNTCSDHFWKLRCSKSARCGAKQISKSKCIKHHMFGPLLEVRMWFCVVGARDSAGTVQETCSCGTSYGPASFLIRGRRSTLGRLSGKPQNALVRGRLLYTQLSIFEGSLAELPSFWCCQVEKLKNWRGLADLLIFELVKFQNWGSLADLLRFWCCQLRRLRKSHRIASLSSLQVDR